MQRDNKPGIPARQQDAQIQKVRESLMKQLDELKEQVKRIQEQSIRQMKNTIDSVFAAQVTESLQEIIDQIKDTTSEIPAE